MPDRSFRSNPHTATAASPLKADPDPSDGRVPDGTGQVLAGADARTEWCLDCHDGSFPASITAPTKALVDIRIAFQDDDAHGIPGGNPSLKSGYGWAASDQMPCDACHTSLHVSDPTPVSGGTNLFQFKVSVMSKDGGTAIPSDGVGFNYETTDNSVKNPQINGYEACSTCHSGAMGSKKANCFSCHFHGTRF